ncbi:helix-turn-helix domain-containing protein [Serratia fonticola]|uniref:helix-turn-helix domain-containing protein n=1 Tax=Serratia fonticola TaxID=47917 RepID=UPI00192AAD6D|nr:helix-turn-helix transcriptional regulator [Serratia fonticola]MBL5859508.1 helix-turn-helix transcriptional regulator [Serratia fonticola]
MSINIKVITENSYFFIGIKEYLQNDEREVSHIDFHELNSTPRNNLKNDDVYIFYTLNYINEILLLISNNPLPGRLIVIPVNNRSNFNIAFEKNMLLKSHANIENILDKINEDFEQVKPSIDLQKGTLTKREKAILTYTINGMNANSISQYLCISIKTVYAHRRNAFVKLGGRNMFEIWPVRKEVLRIAIY